MPDLVVRLEALPFAQIDDSLGRVRVAIDAGKELSVAGLDPTALLGDLGTVIRTVQNLDTDPAALGRLAREAVDALGEVIELPELDDLDVLVARVAELVDLISRLAAVLSTGGRDGPALLDHILTTVGGTAGLPSIIEDVTARAAGALQVEVPDQLTAPLRALARLGADGAIDGRQLTEILSTVVVGLDVGAMLGVTVSARGAVDIVASAGDTAGVEAAVAAVQARIAAAYELMALGEVDVEALLSALAEIGVALDVLGSTELPQLIAGMATDLRTAENQLAELDLTGATERLLTDLPLPGEDIPRIMVDSLRDVADFFDAMTPAALTTALDAARAELSAALHQGPLVELLDGIDDAFTSLGEEVEQLPLRSIRDTIISALVDAQQRVLAFDGFDFLDQVVAPVRDLEGAIREVDLSSITDAVQAAVDQVNGLFDDFPITDLRDAVDEVIEPLGEILDELTPLVQQVAQQLEGLVAELEAIDFDVAAAVTVDQLHAIRDQVSEAVNGGDVPEPVKVVVAGAAAVLSEMDLAGELTSPFETAMVSIDVDELLAPVEGVWAAAGSALSRATPQALIADLDPPFEQLLATVDELSLEPLIASLDGVFSDLLTTLEGIDPRRVVAPLEREFQALLATLRAALDPAPLFAPLRTAYADLRAVVDELDIAAVVNGVLGGMLEMPGGLSQAVGQRLAGQAGAGGPVPQAPAAGGEFKFGDVLRPMAAFVAEIRSRLTKLAGDALGSAVTELATATRGLRALADSSTGFTVQVADALDARVQWLDPRSGSGPLAEVRSSLESLGEAVARVQVDAGAHARLDAAAGSVQLDARVHADVQATSQVQLQAERVRTTADSPGLGRSTRLLAEALDAALPSALLTDDLDPGAGVDAFLDAVFARIDPAPLADELDGYGVRIQGRLVSMADQLTVGLFRMWTELFAGIEPLLPSGVIGRVQAGLDGLTAKLDVLDPAEVESEARAVVDAAVSLLAVHSPAALAAELGAVFDAATERVKVLRPADLLGDLDPFGEVKAQLSELRPSVVLAPLVERAASFTAALETIAAIDLSFVGEVVAEIKVAFGIVLEGIEREWNALLEELSSISGGASVSVDVG